MPTFDMTSKNNFLVKIDDDYKVVINNSYTKDKLLKIIKTYYGKNTIELYPVSDSVGFLLQNISSSNLFLKNNELDPEEFIRRTSEFDNVLGYIRGLDSEFNFQKILGMNKTVGNHGRSASLETKHTKIDPNVTVFDTQIKENKVTTDDETLLTPLPFGDHKYMELENFNDSLLLNISDYNIYFNNQFNTIIVINSKEDFMTFNTKVKNLFPELSLVCSYKLDNTQLEEVNKLNDDIFANVEEVSVRINKIINDKIVDSKLTIKEIKDLIIKYFDIDTDPTHCIKFTNIWTIISNELKVSEKYLNYTKRQLPVILSDLNLQKKRMSDGIYWYGLVAKEQKKTVPLTLNIASESAKKPLSEKEVEEFLKKRESEIVIIEDSKDLFSITDNTVIVQ